MNGDQTSMRSTTSKLFYQIRRRVLTRRKVDVDRTVAVRGNELTEYPVSFFVGRVFGEPAEALGHAKDVRVRRECGLTPSTI